MPDLRAEFNRARARQPSRKALTLALADPLADFAAALDDDIQRAFASAQRAQLPFGNGDLPLVQLMRYHLGYVDEHWRPTHASTGKRMRPRLCLLACQAAGGEVAHALPVATAIELLHNFTLVHDDIQDASPLRRHRPTVWALWGVAQAVNAGDALFALAHIALNRLVDLPVSPATTVELSTALHLTTLRIVEGQTLDLGFEERPDVTADEYLTMIGGKTAAICAYASWAGARVAGVDAPRAAAFGAFGQALGVGFQVHDDLLGVWGATSATGKAAADDIRRRKKSLPVLVLRERADASDRERIGALYAQPELNEGDVAEVLALLTRYEVRDAVQNEAVRWHDRAETLLAEATPCGPAREALAELVNQLAQRSG
jgi:geranylgeranyl diphosphate synthase type I